MLVQASDIQFCKHYFENNAAIQKGPVIGEQTQKRKHDMYKEEPQRPCYNTNRLKAGDKN